MLRGVRTAAGAALVLCALAPAGGHAAVRASAPCQVIGFSPAFRDDGTALCAHQDYSDLHVVEGVDPTLEAHNGPIVTYLTTDYGRSWHRTAGSGLPGANDKHFSPTLTQVVFSPLFPTDHAIYVWAASDGLFRSTDAGATWTAALVSPLSGEPGTGWLTPLVVHESQSSEGQDTPVGGFAYAFVNTICVNSRHAPTDAIVTWPTLAPANGSQCSWDTQYLVPRNWPTSPALLVATSTDPNLDHPRAEVWTCTPVLDCEQMTVLRAESRALQAWSVPDLPTFYVSTVDGLYSDHVHLHVSHDGGSHWAAATSAERLLGPRAVVSLGLATSPSGGRLTMRIAGNMPRMYGAGVNNTVGGGFRFSDGERIYVSVNSGATWTLVGYAPAPGAKTKSTLPFNAPYGYSFDLGGVWEQADRLFTLAEHDVGKSGVENAGVWCSVDHGKTWAPLCAK